MSSNTDDKSIWKELEAEGDDLWEKAFEAPTPAESRRLWTEAGDFYQRALDAAGLHAPGSLAVARLHRKKARYCRQIGQVEDARKILGEASWIADGHGTPDARLEKARIDLELVRCDFKDKRWDSQRTNAENIIDTLEKWRQRKPWYGQPELSYTLGYAYHMLGIALDELGEGSSRIGKGSKDCWKEADGLLRGISSAEAKRGRVDVKISQAVYWRSLGYCDKAIDIYKELQGSEVPLSPERAVLVRDNLAVAYLDRREPGDIDKAIDCVEQSIKQAEEDNDADEWIWAIEIRLKALKEQISVSDETGVRALLDQADRLYNTSLGLIRPSPEDAPPEPVELHRVMAEVYLAAGKMDKAEEQMASVLKSKWHKEGWEGGDIYITLAMFHQQKGELQSAQRYLKLARECFEDEERRGMVFEVDLKSATIQKDWSSAQEILEEARSIARQLGPQRLETRVEDLRENLKEKLPLDKPTKPVVSKLTLQLTDRPGLEFDIRVIESSRGGEPHAIASLPYAPDELIAILKALSSESLEKARLTIAQFLILRDQGLLLGSDLVSDAHALVGKELYRALFPDELDQVVKMAIDQAVSKSGAVTLQLRFDEDAVNLARYPWELLHDDRRRLLQGDLVRLTRYISYSESPTTLELGEPPWRVLYIESRTDDLEKLPEGKELATVRMALEASSSDEGLFAVDVLSPPTYEALVDKMQTGQYHFLHFDGHGILARDCPHCREKNYPHHTTCQACGCPLDSVRPLGFLAFEQSDNGQVDWVNSETLEHLLYGSTVQVAVLSACRTGEVRGTKLFGGVGPALIQAGVPAVVSMQTSISVDAAMKSMKGFYSGLAHRQSLQEAMAWGRQLIRGPEWFIPTLYLRSRSEV
jgi:tetratricopeptide (TPR) repeat protein